MTTKALPRSRETGFGRLTYWLTVGAGVALLLILAFTAIFREQLGALLVQLKDTPWPAAFGFMESFSYPVTYAAWGAIAIAVGWVVAMRLRYGDWYQVFEKLSQVGILASGKPIDVRNGLRLGAEMAGLCAFTWIVLSPVPIMPGVVHLRTFAWVPAIVGILFGAGTAFVAGWLGSVVWALIAGYWIITHTPLVDGWMVAIFTGSFMAWTLRGRRTREELLAYIESKRLRWLIKCAAVNLVGGLVMAFFVGASLQVTTASFEQPVTWWVGFFTIGVLSDTIPMVIWTALLAEPLLRLLRRHPEMPNF